ncbi:hypothetical protein J2125_000916 [Erwinia toletana]|uniref:Uncharacterized protein n=1 Tax=Winslowiella toletana TaxID=92490 RepID=A0ABS4P540_9GAMM|nr:hypothetical protein [Winslowiella toletana]MBP2167724.1 hypothetical protein [Winslowiella toletana]
MSAETLKEFFVSLGFQVDEASFRKFESVVAGATASVVKMGGNVVAAAQTVVGFTTRIADGLDQLYWSSQRSGAAAKGVQAVSYAASQAGSTADAARSSLENLSGFLRTSPGAEGFLNRLGVQTRDASGSISDMADIFTRVGQTLSGMPSADASQYATMFGIDSSTLMAMRGGMAPFQAEYSQMAQAMGFNADSAAVSSNKFMTSLRSFNLMTGMAQDKIGSGLAEGLSAPLDNLRQQILDNFPKIEQTITRVVEGLIWFAEVIGVVVYRVIQAASDIQQWWSSLDEGSQQLITTFGALVAGWLVLNSAFLASPIGIISALALAIIALYDDYKKWQEGGDSLIDWGAWEPGIKSALAGIGGIIDCIKSLGREMATLLGIDPEKWSLKWEFNNLTQHLGGLVKMLNLIGDLLNALNEGRWSDVLSVGKQLLSQGRDNPDALPGVTSSALNARDWLSQNKWVPASIDNIQNYGMDQMLPTSPVYITSASPGGDATINQQTHINIYDASGGHQIGQEIADLQLGVNSQMIQSLNTRIS